MPTPGTIAIIILVVLILAVVVSCIQIVQQSKAYVIERLGAFHSVWGVGMHFKLPFIERVVKKVSLKEQVADFDPQPVITKDNVTMQIDTVIYFQITDPKLYTYGVEYPMSAIENLTATTLRNIIGELELDQSLTSRDTINAKMRSILDEATDPWVGSPTRLILGFSLPLLLGMLFQQVYSLMDTIIVGRFLSVSALAAVGSTGSICFLIIGFCQGVCAGFSLPIAQRFGAKDEKGLKKYVGNAGIVSVIIAIIMTALTVLLCGHILTWMNTPGDIYNLAYQYLIVIFAGIPVTILYNLLSGYLRSLGNSVIPVIFLIIAAVLNIGLDLLFILVFNMGVFGAAFATVLSQGVSGVLCIIYIAKNVPLLHVSRNDLELDSSYVRNLMVMGLPMGFQYSITAIGSVILQTAVNGLGSIAVASMTAASRISMFMVCPFDALGSTMATYSGQNVGAAKFERVKKGLISASVIGSIYSVLIFVALLFIANYLIYLFVSPSETEVVAQAHQFLLINAFFYIPLVLVNTVRFTIQGMGFSGFAMFAGVAEMIARSLIGLVFVPIFGFSAACFASPLAWILADAFLVPAFIHCLHKLQKAKSSQVTSL